MHTGDVGPATYCSHSGLCWSWFWFSDWKSQRIFSSLSYLRSTSFGFRKWPHLHRLFPWGNAIPRKWCSGQRPQEKTDRWRGEKENCIVHDSENNTPPNDFVFLGHLGFLKTVFPLLIIILWKIWITAFEKCECFFFKFLQGKDGFSSICYL